MPLPPIDNTPEKSEHPSYFSDTWLSLPWTAWVPFSADKNTFYEIPHAPGLYRIRPANKDFLMYISETGRPLHGRLNGLRQELKRPDLMPWNDPHTEAPSLWAWSDWSADREDEKRSQDSANSGRLSNPEDEKRSQDSANSGRLSNLEDEKNPQDSANTTTGRFAYECSAAPLDASAAGRKGMEAFLLYKYRQERGESPLCNFGRFHPRYWKSTNRKEGRRGGRLKDEQQDNPAGWPGTKPLEPAGTPGSDDWMGLEWSGPEPLDPEHIRKTGTGAGLYLLMEKESREIVYIGQSADLPKRLMDHGRKSGEGRSLVFSYQVVGQKVFPHHLKEMENDLIGNYFEHFRKAPEFQFRNSR